MEGNRLSRGLGWLSVGLGLTELALLGMTLRRPRRALGWRLAVTAMRVGVTLVDILAASGRGVRRSTRVSARDTSRALDTAHVPAESWRGSGLAEDIGVPPHPAEAEPDDSERERRMREAEKELGLPHPDPPGLPGA